MTKHPKTATSPRGPYRNLYVSVHPDDLQLADDLAVLMTERHGITWKRSSVFKTALYRGLTDLAHEYGIYPQ